MCYRSRWIYFNNKQVSRLLYSKQGDSMIQFGDFNTILYGEFCCQLYGGNSSMWLITVHLPSHQLQIGNSVQLGYYRDSLTVNKLLGFCFLGCMKGICVTIEVPKNCCTTQNWQVHSNFMHGSLLLVS